MSRIPILDLNAQYRVIRDEAIAAFDRIAESCGFAQGPAAKQFEDEFAAWCGVKECVGVNSGTSALHLALHCLDIGPGDEVITVPMTFIATAWAIYYVGAKPVFVDIDPARRTLDPAKLEAAITPRTKAIIPVHLYGQIADMDPILEIAKRHGIPVIEDAAQAHGATYKGRRAGQLGVMGCFSFYPGKNLGAFGEGGALVTNDEAFAKRARQLRSHAQSERYYHDELGYNYRMDSIQGAMLSLKLKHLDAWNAARARHAKRYAELLADLPVTLPKEFPDSQSVWHCYVIESDRRDHLRQKLAEAGIESGLHYPLPLHLQKACAALGYKKGDFPVSERLGEHCLSLPMFAELTDEQLQRIASALRQALADG
ncbi:MAG: DegT/DnrJ/EryC1/StrS family aminotransferase [Verrucomicrobiaceae bacterium]|nr:DegT/DnrJ/EryC1/StrS family aminotransferase [Verrucomicrobiaceae bacterium]